jgi:RNA polymerase sigma factor (sigma-70 family)
MKHVLRHLRRAAVLSVEEGPSDAQLLEAFLLRRDEVAFEALLRRHGPMVLGVCQRVLRNVHDAEDALQATFLVLARKAGSIRSRQVVGSWLYGVAYRTAMKARGMNAKRQMKERRAGEMTRSQSSSDEELLEQLDHELSRLSDKYRVPVVLCELEGKSRKEVARLLGLPEGTLSSRLAQAKKLLAKRLSRHELAIPVGVLAVGLSPTLRASTLKTVLTAGAVPAKVLALTEGVLKAMLLSKLKITACAASLVVLVGVGASGLTYQATAQEPRTLEYEKVFAKSAESRPASDDLEALRLEIEALRKSLQATRERVKTLEGEVSALKARSGGPARSIGSPSQGTGGSSQGGAGQAMMGGGMMGMGGGMGMGGSTMKSPNQSGKGPMGGIRGDAGMRPKAKSDPVTDAENALKKLKENPGDKKATEALEKALQRLKEREKQNLPAEGTPYQR